ncbi:hypothetical protein [Aureibaculum luteum]|uniref:hypothetical protein n=1 Tax=Aureibaculum luteum TaxID=1548456 RepID=UPI000E55202B|nr:hypothetical protein [Aureibaculum luteum]
MIKFKHIVFLLFFWILIFSCEDKKDTVANSKEETHDAIAKKESNNTLISKTKEQLNMLSLREATTKYGTPQEKEIIKITANSIPYNLEELIKKQYPNKEYVTHEIEIIAASWKVQDQSWIQVWYTLENKVWMPIDMLVTI